MNHRQDLWRYRPEVVSAYRLGMLVFLVTVSIGLANAVQAFGELDRGTILAHVHSGTLGWITLGVFGLTLVLFGGAPGRSTRDHLVGRVVLATAVITACYVIAFWSGSFILRAIFGVAQLGIVGLWWRFAFASVRKTTFGGLSTPQLALFFGLSTLVVGSSLGALAQVFFAMGITLGLDRTGASGDLIGAHVTAQTAGYLYLTAFAIWEWRLRMDFGHRFRLGDATVWVLFVSGLFTALGLLLLLQPLLGLAPLLQLVGVILIVIRVGGGALAAAWGQPTGERHFAIALPWLVVNLALFVVLLSLFVGAQGDFSKIPRGLNPAFAHTLFVGVFSNILFGAMRDEEIDLPRPWPWADHVIFWGLNIGLASFVAVLLLDAQLYVKITAPIMGLSALLGIAVHLVRLAAPLPLPVTRTLES